MCIFQPPPAPEAPPAPATPSAPAPTTEELKSNLDAGTIAKKTEAKRVGASKTWLTKDKPLAAADIKRGAGTFLSKNLGGTPVQQL